MISARKTGTVMARFLTVSTIQSAIGQYALGYSEGSRQGKGSRTPQSGAEREFYEEGYDDSSRLGPNILKADALHVRDAQRQLLLAIFRIALAKADTRLDVGERLKGAQNLAQELIEGVMPEELSDPDVVQGVAMFKAQEDRPVHNVGLFGGEGLFKGQGA